MYFSGEESKDTTFDSDNECIRINSTLFGNVQDNNEQNVRVFLDTHLLRIRNDENEKQPCLERIIVKSDDSVSIETMSFICFIVCQQFNDHCAI